MEALARVGREELLGLGVVVLVGPALCTAEVVQEGRTALALLVHRPKALGSLLVAVQPLAGLVHLVNVTLLALALGVAVLLLLSVAEHPRSLAGQLSLSLLSSNLSQHLSLLGLGHAGITVSKLSVSHVSPTLSRLIHNKPGALLDHTVPLAIFHGYSRAAAVAGQVIFTVDPVHTVVRGWGELIDHFCLLGVGRFKALGV